MGRQTLKEFADAGGDSKLRPVARHHCGLSYPEAELGLVVHRIKDDRDLILGHDELLDCAGLGAELQA